MTQKKPYFIQINGAKIVKNKVQTKVAVIEEIVIDDQKFDDWQAAYSFADQKAKCLKIENGWDVYNLTVIEWVPVKKVVYGLHKNELTKILQPIFDSQWVEIMHNPVMLSVKDRIEDNDYHLLHEIMRSFIVKLSPEFVRYDREVRISDRKSFEEALRDLVEHNYLAKLPKLESESAVQ